MPTNASLIDTFLAGGVAKNVTLETRAHALLSYGVPIAVLAPNGVLSVLNEAAAGARSRTTEAHVALVWGRIAQRGRTFARSQSVSASVLDIIVREECGAEAGSFRKWDGKRLPYGQLSGKSSVAVDGLAAATAAVGVSAGKATKAAAALARVNLVPPMTGESDVVVASLDEALDGIVSCDACIAVAGGSVYFMERLGQVRRTVQVDGDWGPTGLLVALDELGFNTQRLRSAFTSPDPLREQVFVVQSNGDVRVN